MEEEQGWSPTWPLHRAGLCKMATMQSAETTKQSLSALKGRFDMHLLDHTTTPEVCLLLVGVLVFANHLIVDLCHVIRLLVDLPSTANIM